MRNFLKKSLSLFMLASSVVAPLSAVKIPSGLNMVNSDVAEDPNSQYKRILYKVLEVINLKVNAWDEKFKLVNEYLSMNETTTDERERLAGLLYDSVDCDLNVIWNIVKNVLDKNDMQKLNASETQWIKEKGAYEPWLYNWSTASRMKVAEITRLRIYYIRDYIQSLQDNLN